MFKSEYSLKKMRNPLRPPRTAPFTSANIEVATMIQHQTHDVLKATRSLENRSLPSAEPTLAISLAPFTLLGGPSIFRLGLRKVRACKLDSVPTVEVINPVCSTKL